ncbi:hypothetical protein BaRGS_00024034 [Batillaria attramentaria]|uniref:Uncharacterized protein n=1 Tax=Batillaria attramentaria TaxID=370345 RepID=A0ABD0KC82_9CAEN
MSGQAPTIGDRLRSFGLFIWNGEEKQFLGRGGRSWAQIGLFYLIYYACLAGFWIGLLSVFYKTLDVTNPKLTGDASLLKGNPGMGFQPMPDVEYTLIRFREDKATYKAHVDSIKKVLKPYIQAAANSTNADCSQPGYEPSDDEACAVSMAALLAGCNEDNDFGYALDPPRPCVLLRLNKIFDWMPQEYTEDNIADAGVDEELQQKILMDPKLIYIQCTGENPADVDNIGTNITYYPAQGFPHYYYPFKNQKGYLSPLVFVQFNSVRPNVAMMLECRALAPNINFDRQDKEGGVHFELLVDP